ncbi:hypothetical protein BCR44DRAFT_1432214, partial [Catenaria anguillulae PL171]
MPMMDRVLRPITSKSLSSAKVTTMSERRRHLRPPHTRRPTHHPHGPFHVHFLRALYDDTWGGYDSGRRKKPRSAVFVSRGAVCDLFATGKDGPDVARVLGQAQRWQAPTSQVAGPQSRPSIGATGRLCRSHEQSVVVRRSDGRLHARSSHANVCCVCPRRRRCRALAPGTLTLYRKVASSQPAKCVFADCALVLAQRDETLAGRVVTRTVVDSVCGLSVTNDGQVVFARDGVSSWSELVGELRLRLNAEQSGIGVDGLAAVADVRDN